MDQRTLRLLLAATLAAAGCGPARPAAPASPMQPVPDSSPADSPATAAETLPAARPEPDTQRPAGRIQAQLPGDIARAFPGAVHLDTSPTPFPHIAVLGSSRNPIGYVVDSDAAGTTATGYGGPVPVRVLLDPGGRPRRIYILDNSETPAYIDIVTSSGLLERLLAWNPARPDSVDAVTLATRSSRALITAVTATCNRVAAELAAR